MAFYNGRLSAVFFAALLCLSSPPPSGAQTPDASGAGTVGGAAEGAPAGASAVERAAAGPGRDATENASAAQGSEAGGSSVAPESGGTESAQAPEASRTSEGGEAPVVEAGKAPAPSGEATSAAAARPDAVKADETKADETAAGEKPGPETQAQEAPAQTNAVETKPAETQSTEKIGEAQSAETKSDDVKPAAAPAGAEKAAEQAVAPVSPQPAAPVQPTPAAAQQEPAAVPAQPIPAAAPAPAAPAPATVAPAAAETAPPAPDSAAPAAVPVSEPAEPADATLTIASWGGAVAQAQERALFRPFVKETGHRISAVRHDGGALKDLQALKSQGESGGVPWDVVNLSGERASKACEEGLLLKLDLAALFGEAAAPAIRDDFIPGAIQPCAIGGSVWSTVILFNKSTYPKGAPATAKDLFDVARFPGKRAFPRQARYVLELALMADGVETGKVYETLATEEGQARALARLGQIRSHIVWWEHGQEPARLLAAGKAAMAVAYSGQAFTAAAARRSSLGFIWDGQIYHVDFWAIPKVAKFPRAARQFIAFASTPERLAAQTKWFPYGPTRLSAADRIGKHAELDMEMARYTPTSRDNFKNALAFDGRWWEAQGVGASQRFDAWLKTSAAEASAAAPVVKEAPAAKKDEKGEDKKQSKRKSRSTERSAVQGRDTVAQAGGDNGRDHASEHDRRTARQRELAKAAAEADRYGDRRGGQSVKPRERRVTADDFID